MSDLIAIAVLFLVNLLLLAVSISGGAVILLYLFNYVAAGLNHSARLTFGTSVAVIVILTLLGRIIRGPKQSNS